MAQHITQEERDAILAGAAIVSVAGAAIAGLLDGQTSDELDKIISTVRGGLRTLEQRRDSLRLREQGGGAP